MGAAIGAGGDSKHDVNVELNIVPFIDLMSCLTAFLLVAAVWVNIAQINIQPKGKTRDTSTVQDDESLVVLLDVRLIACLALRLAVDLGDVDPDRGD